MSDEMAIPTVRFLGITGDDLEHYGLKRHLIKLTEQDISRLKQLQEYDWFKNNKAWQRQFSMMLKAGAKAEIQALSSRGITFISDTYLPEKIKKQDFID
jgi:DNA topoisomerase-6 subunit A